MSDSNNINLEAVGANWEKAFEKFAQTLDYILTTYSKVLVGVGVFLVLVGLMFLIFNRKVIKVLYFFGGLVVISGISTMIGTAIIWFTKISPILNDPKLFEMEDPFAGIGTKFIICLSTSLGIGLLVGIISAIYGKVGIVLVGLACGMMIGLSIGVAIGNPIAIICLTIGLGIIVAILCGFFKRLFEVLTSAITGGFLFSNGYRLIFTGAVYLSPHGIEGEDKYSKIISISTLAVYIVVTVVFGIYHLFTYERKPEVMSQHDILLKKTPAYNPI
ncbi:hypothetical protein K502DRAFT_353934 [Neoconidiobolus thromboides FSU 785]|nr:hypothetical protein K502DRAFT_353934 [Neoconidiobolus thromboides FSU 785]